MFWDTKKSSIPEISIPRGRKAAHRLEPSTQGMDRIKTQIKLTSTAFFRLHPLSIQKEMIFSKTAMMVDKAAKDE